MQEKLKTVDGATLMAQPLRPPNFIVDTLLSQGLHVLAGSPKVGKSWLALWLAVTVAKGEPVWGMHTRQGTTLYLCLEDSQLRIQNRLFGITKDAPDNVHFCTDCALLGKGLERQMESFIAEHPDTVLIIIDTLQMIRGGNGDSTYAGVYQELSVLKHIADAHGLAIIVIHHLRKKSSNDIFERISGSTAMMGAVDSSFVLMEDRRSSGRAKLQCIGRDIEYRELELERSTENIWQVTDVDTAPQAQPEEKTARLVSVFMEDSEKFIGTPTELAMRLDPAGVEGVTAKTVARKLAESSAALKKAGFSARIWRSNGRRLIELRRADGDDNINTARCVTYLSGQHICQKR